MGLLDMLGGMDDPRQIPKQFGITGPRSLSDNVLSQLSSVQYGSPRFNQGWDYQKQGLPAAPQYMVNVGRPRG
jgi:hypothetical protein